jgi:predicted secreted Zn-dependent protease
MRSRCFLTMLIFFSIFYVTIPTWSQPTSHTTYLYFTVQGNSLPELHRDMARNGPTANGVRGYGTTTALIGRRMLGTCNIKDSTHLDLEFQIRLPRAATTSALSVSDQGLWSRFTQFVKKHEETHRTIWMSCAAEYDRMLQAGQTKVCASNRITALKLYRTMLATCGPKQVLFDQTQYGVLMKNPFIKHALK